MNKKYIICAVVILVILLGAVYFSGKSQYSPIDLEQVPSTQPSLTEPTTVPGIVAEITPATAYIVSIADSSFNPETLDINKGNIVIWTNEDSVPHQIVGTGFDGPVINMGQSYTFAFINSGTFDYSCALHPSMKGEIIVK